MRGGKPTKNAAGQVREKGPAVEPVETYRSRFGKLPSWALMPRDVARGLGAVVAAAVVIVRQRKSK